MSQELKPCPFCGAVPAMETDVVPRNFMARISCPVCGAEKSEFCADSSSVAKQRAIAAWNTRASDPRIAELEEEVERLRVRLDAMLGLLDAAKTVLEWMNQLPIPTEGCTAKGMLLHRAISRAQP